MPNRINGKNIASWIGTANVILIAILGVNFGVFKDRIVEMWHAPESIVVLEKKIAEQDSINQLNENRWEMDFELDRLMTDNDDSLVYVIETNGGRQVYDVDVRNTAEDVEMAFIFDLYIPYPVNISVADGRKYIILHNKDEKQNTYLVTR